MTAYTYHLVNHLIGVSMPRKVGSSIIAQTRTFHYNAKLQRGSKTELETGTATYTYNPDATLATRVDAKSQKTECGYDTYRAGSGANAAATV